jgi:hypothetical protein
MSYQSTIRAFQGVLESFEFSDSMSFPEEFAQKRFLKKMERPCVDTAKERADKCWSDFIAFDAGLPTEIVMPSRRWYEARIKVHETLKGWSRVKTVPQFPKGSEFTPTRGRNSIEARLAGSDWTCTPDNFPAFARMCYGHKALRRTVKRRYQRWFKRGNFDDTRRMADFRLYRAFDGDRFRIFSWKLERLVTWTYGSRFSTVRKNNDKDRPINIEPFANLMVQRGMGEKIRLLIKRGMDIDLNLLAGIHRIRISDGSVATIDMRNASDSNSRALCMFLLPDKVFRELDSARSPFLLGPDGDYHLLRKMSSMGNGYTFELMSLFLNALCRCIDPNASVFGDDIIIAKEHAAEVIGCLEETGWQVNVEKSFVDGPFRESCGANYHDDHGYIESYDFVWPENIHDCAVVYNKSVYLARKYPSFERLLHSLHRFVPRVLQGGPQSELSYDDELRVFRADLSVSVVDSRPLTGYFQTGQLERRLPLTSKERRLQKAIATRFQLARSDVSFIFSFELRPDLRSKTVRCLTTRTHWAKYEMYLFSGRVSKDVLTGVGSWVPVKNVVIGSSVTRFSSLTHFLTED